MAQLVNQVVEEYKKNPQDEKFADRARQIVNEYYTTHKRKAGGGAALASVQVKLIQIKKAIMGLGNYHEKYAADVKALKEQYPDSKEVAEFGQADMWTKERIKRFYLKKTGRTAVELAIRKVHVVPSNIRHLGLSQEDAVALVVKKQEIVKKKAEAPVEIHGDALMDKVFTRMLTDDKKGWVPGLLLATGRRLGEVLLSAKFSPVKGNEYEAWFKGQLKTVALDAPEFKIPLLMPLPLIQEVLGKVRGLYDTRGMTPEAVHDKYETNIVRWTREALKITPHTLRSYYAVICDKLFNQTSSARMEFSGYVSKILGHSNLGSAPLYQRVILKETTRLWRPKGAAPEIKEEKKVVENMGLVYSSVPEYKRMEVALDMMKKKILITASAMKRHGKGTMPLNHKFIEKNKAVLEAYNATL